MKKIAIVNANSFAKYLPEFMDELEKIGEVDRITIDKDITSQNLSKALKGYSYVILGTTPIFDEEFFRLTPSIEYIARFGIGYNNVDVLSAKKYGVIVSNVPGYLEKYDVAEHAVSLLLALFKHICDGNEASNNDKWSFRRERFLGTRIHGKKIGILGFGNIGSTFAQIMKRGFDCEIFVYDPFVSHSKITNEGGQKVELEKLLKDSDIISIHMNLSESNYHILNKDTLSNINKEAIIINTARGELVDEKAIAEAIMEGRLKGYGTDVIENEPIKKGNPLISLSNVIITPHLATYSIECNEQMCRSIVDDINRVHNNEKPISYLNE